MPCFALVSYFGWVSISIGFSSFGKFEFRFQHFLFCFFSSFFAVLLNNIFAL